MAGATIRLLAKAGQLVSVLGELGRATPAELAKELDEPRPSVYRLVAALSAVSLVRTTPTGKVELDTGVLRLGEAAAGALVERQVARPELERLRESTGQTTYLCVLRGQRALCVDRLEGRRVALLVLAPGRTLDLHAGGASKALLAFSPELWEPVLSRAPLPALTARTLVTDAELRADLEATVERGYSLSDEDVTPGVAAVGAPVVDGAGRLRAAISVAGLREAVLAPDARTAEVVVEAARRASEALRALPGRA